MNLSDVEKGYIAGIFDGEGCVYIRKSGRQKNRVATITTNTNLDCLKRIKMLTNSGYITKRDSGIGYKTVYRLTINRIDHQLELLTILAPILIIKKKKAKEAIRLLKHSKSLGRASLDT